jgi:hypothetical protein
MPGRFITASHTVREWAPRTTWRTWLITAMSFAFREAPLKRFVAVVARARLRLRLRLSIARPRQSRCLHLVSTGETVNRPSVASAAPPSAALTRSPDEAEGLRVNAFQSVLAAQFRAAARSSSTKSRL